MSLGDHCSVSHCRQRDFLPFKCSACEEVFCLEHRTHAAHACSVAEHRDQSTTAICPLCARLLKIEAGQDPNAVFESHTAQGCDPANYDRVMKKPRCPAPGCKERLNLVNTHTCKHCATAVCMGHRFPDDHSCQRNPKHGPHRDARPLLSKLLGIGAATQGNQNASQANAQRAVGSAQRPRASNSSAIPPGRSASGGEPRRTDGRTQATQQSSRVQQAGNGSTAGWTGREECPVCERSFGSLAALIAHSREHDPETADLSPCPHCRKMFKDAVALVEHVETQHSSSAGCVVC